MHPHACSPGVKLEFQAASRGRGTTRASRLDMLWCVLPYQHQEFFSTATPLRPIDQEAGMQRFRALLESFQVRWDAEVCSKKPSPEDGRRPRSDAHPRIHKPDWPKSEGPKVNPTSLQPCSHMDLAFQAGPTAQTTMPGPFHFNTWCKVMHNIILFAMQLKFATCNAWLLQHTLFNLSSDGQNRGHNVPCPDTELVRQDIMAKHATRKGFSTKP